jgi:hypothetical protein
MERPLFILGSVGHWAGCQTSLTIYQYKSTNSQNPQLSQDLGALLLRQNEAGAVAVHLQLLFHLIWSGAPAARLIQAACVRKEPGVSRRILRKYAISVLAAITALVGSGFSQRPPAQAPLANAGTPYLIFSTYLGGVLTCLSCSDGRTFAQNVTSDTQGNIYVTGATESVTLPVRNAWQPRPAPHSSMSAFVAKYDPAGELLWMTYLGGNNKSVGWGIAAMPGGGAAVLGLTSSDEKGPFPTKNAFRPNYQGNADYFVSVFDANGNMLYSTYLGGYDIEGGALFVDNASNGNSVAVDARGLVYVTGTTSWNGIHIGDRFPVTSNAIQSQPAGPTDAFLSIFDVTKIGVDSLIYSSFLGGQDNEKGHSVTVNTGGSLITVAGYTDSSDFPTTANSYRPAPPPHGFTSNVFVAQFRSTKPGDPTSEYSAVYATYLGANSKEARDDTYGITQDKNGIIFATGRTESRDFPMTKPGFPSIYNSAPYLAPGKSGDEAYLVKIDPLLCGEASLVYSTYLGGGSPDGLWGTFATSVGVDSHGAVYVGGETSAAGVEYVYSQDPVEASMPLPYTDDALFKWIEGPSDTMLMRLSGSGSRLEYSTFFGGHGSDRLYGLNVDPDGNVIVTGLTSSSDFPVKNPAEPWPGNSGEQNAFITKFGFASANR